MLRNYHNTVFCPHGNEMSPVVFLHMVLASEMQNQPIFGLFLKSQVKKRRLVQLEVRGFYFKDIILVLFPRLNMRFMFFSAEKIL